MSSYIVPRNMRTTESSCYGDASRRGLQAPSHKCARDFRTVSTSQHGGRDFQLDENLPSLRLPGKIRRRAHGQVKAPQEPRVLLRESSNPTSTNRPGRCCRAATAAGTASRRRPRGSRGRNPSPGARRGAPREGRARERPLPGAWRAQGRTSSSPRGEDVLTLGGRYRPTSQGPGSGAPRPVAVVLGVELNQSKSPVLNADSAAADSTRRDEPECSRRSWARARRRTLAHGRAGRRGRRTRHSPDHRGHWGPWSIESRPPRLVRRSRPHSCATRQGESSSATVPALNAGNASRYRSLFGFSLSR